MESRLRICRVVSVGIVALGLVVASLAHPATGQVTLEDALARSFDVAVTIAPVDRSRGNGTLTGRARIGLEITALSPISRLQMELNSRLTVKSVRAEETQVSFSRSGSGLTLSFGQPQTAGNRLTVTVEYEGQPSSIFNEYVILGEGTLYPVLVSPFGDYSANLARVTLQVTAPPDYTAVTTGRQVSAEGGTVRWDSEVTVPWVALVGGRRHRRVDRSVGNLRLQMYVGPGEDRNLDKLATYTGQAVEFYSRLLYPFPYTELKVISLVPISGGIGYPAMLMIDDRAFTGTFPEPYNRDSYLFQLMAHEAAHSYVPSQTVPRGTGFIWLSEGFAEYLSLMATEAVVGSQGYARELQEERDDYAPVAGTASDTPIGRFTFGNYYGSASRRIIYAKGSLVLHMLRFVLGDDVFKRALAAYFQQTRGRSVRVDGFREVMEDVSGQKLEWFFDEWITRMVLPDYIVASATSTRADDGQYRTTATIRNSGTGAMPVDVAFGTGEARVIRRVEVPSRGETVATVTTPQAIRQIEVDPSKWLIQSNYKNDAFEIK